MIVLKKSNGYFYLKCSMSEDGELTIALNHNSDIGMIVNKDELKNYILFYSEEEKDKEVSDAVFEISDTLNKSHAIDKQLVVESAVAEHDQAMQDTLQGYMDNEQQLLEQIEELKAKVLVSEHQKPASETVLRIASKEYIHRLNNKIVELTSEILESHNDKKLLRMDVEALEHDRDKALAELNELKAKVSQPVEVSKDLADVIKYMKERSFAWEGHFLFNPKVNPFFSSDSAWYKLIASTDYSIRLSIIQNGYTVKPDPLREGIASLVARYTNEDGVSGETDLIEKLAEYVRGHFGGGKDE